MIKKTILKTLFTVILAAGLSLSLAQAGIRLPSIIGDNMVLQRNQENPIWGWADAGQEATITFAGQSVSAKADASGKWTVKLAALKTSTKGREMKITVGAESKILKNILVGDVWICSGQSNMAFRVGNNYTAAHHNL